MVATIGRTLRGAAARQRKSKQPQRLINLEFSATRNRMQQVRRRRETSTAPAGTDDPFGERVLARSASVFGRDDLCAAHTDECIVTFILFVRFCSQLPEDLSRPAQLRSSPLEKRTGLRRSIR